MNVSRRDIKKLTPLLNHYQKKPHPFTACVRDNRKRFGPLTEKYCAVLKDTMRGTTMWRSTERKKKAFKAEDTVELPVTNMKAAEEFFGMLSEMSDEEAEEWTSGLIEQDSAAEGSEVEIEIDAEDGGDGEESTGEEDSEPVEDSTAEDDSGEGKSDEAAVELTGPIVSKSAQEQVGYSAVLIPGERDSDNDVVTKSKIREVAHDYMLNHRYMDEQHTLKSAVAYPVESYITMQDMEVQIAGKSEVLPEGSWIIGAKITDHTWRKVMSGELDGLSVMGVRKSDYQKALSTAQKSADGAFSLNLKRVTLSELGDFITPAVSLVKGPAVPKAKWFALKSKEAPREEEDQQGGLSGFFKNMFTAKSEQEVDVKLTKEELQQMIEEGATKAAQAAVEAALKDEDEDKKTDTGSAISFESEEELQTYITSAVEEALAEEEGEEDEEEAEEQNDEVAEEVASLKSRIEELEKGGKTSRKSRHIVGQGEGGGGKDDETQDINTYLGRDSFGRAKVS